MKKYISILLFIVILFASCSIAWAKSSLLYVDTVVLDSTTEYTREEVLRAVVKSAEEKKPVVIYTEQKEEKEEKQEKAPGFTLRDFFKGF